MPDLWRCSQPGTFAYELRRSIAVTKHFLIALATLGLLTAACGSGTASDDQGAADDRPTAAGAGDDAGESETGEAADHNDDHSDGDDHGDDGDDHGVEDEHGDVEAGSADDRSLTDAEQGPLGALLFADTTDDPDAPASARFEGRFSITGAPGSELPGTFELVLAGGYDEAAEAMELSMDMSELMTAAAASGSEQVPTGFEDFFLDPIEIIVIGDMGWMKWGLFSMFTGQDDVWIEMEADEVSGATEDFGFSSSAGDPTALLEDLADADASLEDLGVETVNGVEARHWRALVDLGSLSADASPEELAELEEQFGDLSATEFPIDVWIGVEDGLIYRYVVDLASEAFFDGSDGDIVSSTMTFDFFDYGADLGIAPPPVSEVISGDTMFAG